MDIRDLLTIEVLESGISDMILDNVSDMNEIRFKTFHIRKLRTQNYKIYNDNGYVCFNTHSDYELEVVDSSEENFLTFIRAFINAMKNQDRLESDMVKEILKEAILYAYKKDKDILMNFINVDDIQIFIEQGINDGLEDIIFRSQFEEEILMIYSDYTFNYEHHEVILDENDFEDLAIPDENWRNQNLYVAGSDMNLDNLVMESSMEEINRFKTYLESKNELIKIEELIISSYITQIVYPYPFDYIRFINRIMNWESIETSDDEMLD